MISFIYNFYINVVPKIQIETLLTTTDCPQFTDFFIHCLYVYFHYKLTALKLKLVNTNIRLWK